MGGGQQLSWVGVMQKKTKKQKKKKKKKSQTVLVEFLISQLDKKQKKGNVFGAHASIDFTEWAAFSRVSAAASAAAEVLRDQFGLSAQ